MTTAITRRTMLRGAGVAMALPFLESMRSESRAHSAELELRRIVAINFELSFHPPNLIPQQAGREYELSKYLQPLKDLRNQFTVISGASHPEVDGGHAASKSWLSAAPHPGAANFRNTISMDQLAAWKVGRATRFASRQMGAGISISSNGVQVPGSNSPAKHFRDMFLEGRPDQKAKQIELLREGRSVLDAVQEASKRMQRRVSKNDRRKLAEFFSAVRDAENNFEKSEEWQHKPKPRVDSKPPTPLQSPAQIAQKSAQFYDVIFLALQTDSTRVITYPINDGQYVPAIPGVSQNYHNLSHHGKDPDKLKQLALVESEYVRLFGNFVRRLKETSEGDSNLLDRTMVLMGSHMHSGNHNNRNLPTILAGGGFHHGQHLAFDQENNTPLANLYLSMLQRMGLETDRFASSTGTLQGLLPA